MIMYEDEEVRHRKKSQRRPPKKSNHKHDYQPCILRAPIPDFNETYGLASTHKLIKASYCPICGKIEEYDFASLINGTDIKEEILGLPTFTVENLFMAKYVDLK